MSDLGTPQTSSDGLLRDADSSAEEPTSSGHSGHESQAPRRIIQEPGEASRLTSRWLLFSIWAIVIFLGLPLWVKTTWTERRSLPSRQVQRWVDHTLRQDGCPLLFPVATAATKPSKAHPCITLDLEQADAPAPSVTSLDAFIALKPDQDRRIIKYAPKYKVAFSLLFEEPDGSTPDLSRDLQTSIQNSILPALQPLEDLHRFDVETHVQYYAPLTIELHRSIDAETGLNQTVLSTEDIKTFVNSAQWSLATTASLDPVLHFVLFVPSKSHTPMSIDAGSPQAEHSFIVPQWGGVYLLNHLDAPALSHAFDTFAAQLHLLLGLPKLVSQKQSLDALMRARILEASQEAVHTLDSTIQLAKRQTNLRINRDVQRGVQSALANLDQIQAQISRNDLATALKYASYATGNASEAFFHPSMLALLYFPDEHRFAVYTPLFGPIALPVVMTTIRELRAWLAERRARGSAGKVKTS